jgi:hypothetical protein
MKHKFFIFLAACAALLPAAALASNKVSSPDVTKGLAELEWRGGYDIDDEAAKDGRQSHKFVANYGITERWRMEAKLVAAGDDDDYDWTYAEWSNRLQLTKEGFAKVAVQGNYKQALQGGAPNVLEATLLASKDTGPLTHVTNLTLDWDVGDDAADGTGLNLGWKTKYRLMPHFDPGVEFYADFGKIGHDMKDKFLLGPVASGQLVGSAKYDAGVLFGLNEAVPDARLKAIITYGF